MLIDKLEQIVKMRRLQIYSSKLLKTGEAYRAKSFISSSATGRVVEERWREFFSNPTLWWDHRSEKTNARYPDFTHKETQEPLWLNGRSNPLWVETELAALAPEQLQKNLYSWNVMLSKYRKKGENRKTLELFQQMQQEGMNPDKFTFVTALKACTSLGVLDEGSRLHAQIIRSGCESDLFVGSSLIDMYGKFGRIEDAQGVFNKMTARDVVMWTAMINGYVKCHQGWKALQLFQEMQLEQVEPNAITFVAVLNACASILALEEGRRVHVQIIGCGCESDPFVRCSLIDMYAKCGSLEDAWKVFNKWPSQDVVTWNSMIMGYTKGGQGQKALELFQQMQQKGLEPDLVTFCGVLNACASEAALEEGRRIHMQIMKFGFESETFVASSLVDMYAKCGSIEDSLNVFNKMPTRDAVSWNTVILGCVKCGHGRAALELSQQMRDLGMKPDTSTFVGILNACASLGDLEEGKRVHAQIIQSGWESDLFVGSSLVDMYAKCGSIGDAWRVFIKIRTRDVVAWTSMIKGYSKCGQGLKALELFRQMQVEGVQPDGITFVAAINACANTTALEEGKCIHGQILESDYQSDVFVANSLIDMYAKCGSIEDAWTVFQGMPTRDVISWNSMLGGFGMHGYGKEALRLFERMHQLGVEMNGITFVCLLSACSHSGLVDEGIRYFESINSVYGIPVTVEHYSCMVDLLGRAGRLREAEDMIKKMSCSTYVNAWKALLGACRVHGNVKMGERVAKQVLELDPQNASGYVLLSNIYAAAGEWDHSARIQQLRKERGVKKQPGCTWISVYNEVHSFIVDDQAHPQIGEIHAELERLSGLLKDAGYVPDTHFALHDVEEEEKVGHLGNHSEKLAIAYGLISTPPGTPIRIFKNLRVCGDCHTATKFIAKVTHREIIVRDGNRFHHFRNGLCSCKDYW